MNKYLLIVCLGVIQPNGFYGELVNMKIVDEPSSYGLNNAAGNYYHQFSDSLKMKVKPGNFSGPPHFERMLGKCYSSIFNDYKYELCPFSNVTQYEQTLRWNPYSGVLGVWQDWEIKNNTYVAMVMENGDSCGEKNRLVKVFFKCGKKTEIKNVSEPATCEYHLIVQSPLVCPVDSMLVYPSLPSHYQLQWDQLETSLANKDITQLGYDTKLHQLFEELGIYLSKEKKKLLSVKSESDNIVKAGHETSKFNTLDKCDKEYNKLSKINEKLVKMLNDNGIEVVVEEDRVKVKRNTTNEVHNNNITQINLRVHNNTKLNHTLLPKV